MSDFDSWAVLELMGHRKLAGRVRDVEMFGERVCRIDIPSEPPKTQYYAAKAIFGVHPEDEAVCVAFARRAGPPTVVQPWELLTAPALPSSTERFDDRVPTRLECAECGGIITALGVCEDCDAAEDEAEEDGRVSSFDGGEPESGPRCEYHDECMAPVALVMDGDPLCRMHAKAAGADTCEACERIVDPAADRVAGGFADSEGVYLCSVCAKAPLIADAPADDFAPASTTDDDEILF